MKDGCKEKVILFGARCGEDAVIHGFFEEFDIVAVVDSDPKVWGFIAFGCCVVAPDQINNYNYDLIYVTSVKWYQEIRNQLINSYNIDQEKIKLIDQYDSSRNIEKELQYLRNAIIGIKLENFKKNNELIKISSKLTKINEISMYWNAHTVHDNWFVSAEESYEYCIERFNMYPKFREFSQMDRMHDDDIILDYGCGLGNDMVWFIMNCKAKHVIGIDVSRTALENAQFRLALHNIKNSDAELIQIDETEYKIPLENESIDFVNCQGVLMHTSNPVKIVKEFSRVLKKSDKSCASIMVYNKDSIWYHLYAAYYLRYVDNTMFAGVGKTKFNKMAVDDIFECSTDGINCPRARCWTEKEFISILQNAGFTRIEYKGGYPNNLEPIIAQKYMQQAMEDSRLEEVHKEFLRKVSFNKEGYPMYNGKLCCVGGVYICYL